MGSIIEGYTSDIFISYRQNDNKYDNWVTDFVANLSRELQATIKYKINIYLDQNPYDGLVETNVVDESLEGRLKSLIFIPILSQTYCDLNSFAWHNEFLTFNRISREDSFGSIVTLRNGNASRRILPVRIHNLDNDDINLLEAELGGQLRSIDFVYSETGVNRPLRPEDNEDKNLNKTKYRNQLNKVANSIKEILFTLKNPDKAKSPSDEFLSVVRSTDKSIAVLPFINLSNDPEQEFLSDGISEEIIVTLVQIPGLKVAGRTSAFSFKNKNEDVRNIGEKLNVNTILEGSVRKFQSRIRVNVQLIEVSTGFQLWSQKFDREFNDMFIVQVEIAKAIVDKLEITLSGKPVRPKERPHSQNVEAYKRYLEGMAAFYKRGLRMFEGLECFEHALKFDPDYTLALAGLADSYTMLCLHSYYQPEEAWPKAAEAIDRAEQIGSGNAEVHASIATIALLFERNWGKAEREYLNALKINPHYLQARSWYAVFYLQNVMFNQEEALKQARIAVENDPLSSYAHAILSTVASNAGSNDEAIAAGLKGVEFDPESFLACYYLGYSHHNSGNYTEAVKSYKHAIGISGRHNWAIASLLALYMDESDQKNQQKGDFLYRELMTKSKMGYVSPSILAISSATVGRNEEAIRYTIQALDSHDPYYIVLIMDRPDNRALRSLPEFIEIMKLRGLH